MTAQKGADGKEVAKHNSRETVNVFLPQQLFLLDTCGSPGELGGVWIVVHGKVYDVTDFLDEHPGGAEIILRYAGMDATEEYEPIHPPDAIIDNLDPSKHLGPLIPSTLPPPPVSADPPPPTSVQVPQKTNAPLAGGELEYVKPPLAEILSLHDFEAVARRTMGKRGWNYYSSGADDEITMRENHNAYHRVWFRPRILRDVGKVDYSSSIFGFKTSMPVYITATALGKLGHPEGEVCLTRAAAEHDVIQMIPTLASCSFDEMVDAAQPGQVQFLQLYVNADRSRTKKIIKHAAERGIKALFITVDAPQLGRREKDMRTKFEGAASSQQAQGGDKFKRDEGAARAISSFIDPSLNWNDLADLKEAAGDMKVVLKGVQCWEDAVRAAEVGMDGIVLSNHGGRQLDFAPSPLTILPQVVSALTSQGHMNNPARPGPKFEVFIDGGVRRATDVLKAIALGATAVGIGRPMIYAMSTFGEDGVSKALQILKDEFEMNMRLLGAPTLSDVVPSMVDISALGNASGSITMYEENYERMLPVGYKAKL
ncbi:L-lactate dehydrogenase (cytochrome) [Kwoniella heveanensis BCC8398]|uniref:L-lactate dehydrogenase (cytochrome) n=1 Tax=Kwoniella heveanensis BCC8398 TaxID=1296120 RepID=A0A1B9GI59_9TREE|nr:L-lactate dehydrogenase (cytochrome) [Kwoniella heveanensis BCC8398]